MVVGSQGDFNRVEIPRPYEEYYAPPHPKPVLVPNSRPPKLGTATNYWGVGPTDYSLVAAMPGDVDLNNTVNCDDVSPVVTVSIHVFFD